MGKNILSFTLFLASVAAAMPSFALVPLESLILGNLDDNYSEERKDPIAAIFQAPVTQGNTQDYQRSLANYRGYIQEGLNTKNACRFKSTSTYASMWDHDQAMRSFIATMQYLGLDVTSRAIAQYAKHFEFDDSQYTRLVDSLIGNYCSRNISVIGLKALKQNFLIKFSKENNFALPDISQNPLFPKALSSNAGMDAREREFILTIRLFRAFCSWGGEVENTRMLVPLLKDPFFVGFVARQMAGLKTGWEALGNNITLVKDPESTQVLCTNLICRRTDRVKFERKIPRMIGSRNLLDDYSRMYCQDFRDLDYRTQGQVPQVAAWIRAEGLDEEYLMRAHLTSLVTGVPDILVRAKTFQEGRETLRLGVDRIWNQWAANQVVDFHQNLFYEEALTVERVDRKLYFDAYRPDFSVAFDVNLGEFDRLNQLIGKVHTAVHLKVPKSFLGWIRREWIYLDPREPGKRERLVSVFNHNIHDQLEKVRQKFIIPPWNGDLSTLVSREILAQLELYRGNFFKGHLQGMIDLPITFSYAPFALKYLQYEFAMTGGAKQEGASIETPTEVGSTPDNTADTPLEETKPTN